MATNITITNTLLNSLRTKLVEMIANGQYRIGNTWYTSPIDIAEVRQNGSIRISYYIEPKDSALTPANMFRLRSSDGKTLVSRTETISFSADIPRMLYQFRFEIFAREEAA